MDEATYNILDPLNYLDFNYVNVGHDLVPIFKNGSYTSSGTSYWNNLTIWKNGASNPGV